MHILVADIGGTNLRLAEILPDGSIRRYSELVGGEKSITSFIERGMKFFDVKGEFALVIGAAGPVKNGICRLTKNQIVIDQTELRVKFKVENIYVLNDLELIGYYCAVRSNYHRLNRKGLSVVIAAGTGLGLSIIVNQESGFSIFPTEYEHASGNNYSRYLHGHGIVKLYREVAENQSFKTSEEIIENSKLSKQPGDEDANKVVDLFIQKTQNCLLDIIYQYLPENIFLGGSIFKIFYPFIDLSEISKSIEMKTVKVPIPQIIFLPDDAPYYGGMSFLENEINLTP